MASNNKHAHTAAQDDNRVTMKGQAIPRVKAHDHLGLKVTSTLSWTEHISRTRAKCGGPASGYDQEDPSSPLTTF